MLFMWNGVYENLLRKRFHKTSLSLLDLRFKIFIFQDEAFSQCREEGWRSCDEMTPDVLQIVKHWLFGQSVVIMYQMSVINKVYILVGIYYTWRLG